MMFQGSRSDASVEAARSLGDLRSSVDLHHLEKSFAVPLHSCSPLLLQNIAKWFPI